MGNLGNYIVSGEFIEDNPLYEFESDYWGNCCNTADEENKQLTYAKLMEIPKFGPNNFYVSGKKILDIGGGPVSLLLKCYDHGGSKVVDPIKYPQWTIDRYASHNIEYDQKTGEEVNETGYDEVWIYNCLQHVIDPQKIIENAKKAAPVLRIFEWIDIPAHKGHPHELKEAKLNEWIGGTGKVSQIRDKKLGDAYDGYREVITERLNNKPACYYGVFKFNKNKI